MSYRVDRHGYPKAHPPVSAPRSRAGSTQSSRASSESSSRYTFGHRSSASGETTYGGLLAEPQELLLLPQHLMQPSSLPGSQYATPEQSPRHAHRPTMARDSVSVTHERREKARFQNFQFPNGRDNSHSRKRQKVPPSRLNIQSTPDSLDLPTPMEDPSRLRSPPPAKGTLQQLYVSYQSCGGGPSALAGSFESAGYWASSVGSEPDTPLYNNGRPSPAVAAIFADINRKASKMRKVDLSQPDWNTSPSGSRR